MVRHYCLSHSASWTFYVILENPKGTKAGHFKEFLATAGRKSYGDFDELADPDVIREVDMKYGKKEKVDVPIKITKPSIAKVKLNTRLTVKPVGKSGIRKNDQVIEANNTDYGDDGDDVFIDDTEISNSPSYEPATWNSGEVTVVASNTHDLNKQNDKNYLNEKNVLKQDVIEVTVV